MTCPASDRRASGRCCASSGPAARLKAATVDEIAAVPGIGRARWRSGSGPISTAERAPPATPAGPRPAARAADSVNVPAMQRALPILVAGRIRGRPDRRHLPAAASWWQRRRAAETRLGLDLIGGLRGEYQVVATDDQAVTSDILEQTRDDHREPRQRHRRRGAHRPDPGCRPHLGRAAGRRRRGRDPRASSAPPASSSSCPCPAALQGTRRAKARCRRACRTSSPSSRASRSPAPPSPRTPPTREIVVDLQLKDTGARLFDEYAAEHYGEQFAIVLDDQVMSAPTIQATRFGGQAQISGGQGGFPVEEANARHRPEVRLAAAGDPRGRLQQHLRARSASTSCTQTVLAGARRHRPRLRLHAHLLPRAGRQSRASR